MMQVKYFVIGLFVLTFSSVADAVWKVRYPTEGQVLVQTMAIDFWGNRDSNEEGGQLEIGMWDADAAGFVLFASPPLQPDGANKWKRPVGWDEYGLPDESDVWAEGQYSAQILMAEEYLGDAVVFTVEAFE